MESTDPQPKQYNPADLDGKTLVFIRRKDRGYEADISGKMQAIGSTVWLNCSGGLFPLIEFDTPFLEPVFPSNRVPACKGFDFFSVRK